MFIRHIGRKGRSLQTIVSKRQLWGTSNASLLFSSRNIPTLKSNQKALKLGAVILGGVFAGGLSYNIMVAVRNTTVMGFIISNIGI
jgi:hypothetical protein